MISHDPDLRRLAGRRATVEQLTVARAAAHRPRRRAGLTARSPRRSMRFPETRFNIDIKIGGRRATRPSTRSGPPGATDRVLIGSFSADAAAGRRPACFRASRPRSRLAVRSRPSRPRVPAIRLALRRILRDVQAVQLPESVLGMQPLHARARSRAFHAAGVEVHAWTINDPADHGTAARRGRRRPRHRPRRPRAMPRACERRALPKHPETPVKALETAHGGHASGHPVVIPDSAEPASAGSADQHQHRRPHDGRS